MTQSAGLLTVSAILINGQAPQAAQLFVGSDNEFEIDGASIDGVYQNASTVAMQLLDANRVTISGATATLTYIAASNGNYRGSMAAASATLAAGTRYIVQITVTKDSATTVISETETAAYRS